VFTLHVSGDIVAGCLLEQPNKFPVHFQDTF